MEVSPRDFEDSSDVLPSSSFQNDQVHAEYDEDEINYMNVSPVSERDRESLESEDEELSVTTSFQRSQAAKSPPKSGADFSTDSLNVNERTLLWDLLQDNNVV